MARYIGPVTKKARSFGEPVFGYDKAYEKRKFPPGQHGQLRKRKQRTDYAFELLEKQKAKYTYGVLERQFRNLFDKAAAKSGVTGVILLQLLESRLDNVVYRMGIAKTRRAARQLVTHRHILVDGILSNIPSMLLKPGAVVSVRENLNIWMLFNPMLMPKKTLTERMVGLSGMETRWKVVFWPILKGRKYLRILMNS